MSQQGPGPGPAYYSWAKTMNKYMRADVFKHPVPVGPAKSTSEVTGLPHTYLEPIDNFRGPQLAAFLKTSGIDMEAVPPFMSLTTSTGVSMNGVIKINNIPFTVTDQEIAHFISRFTGNTPMLKKNHQGCPIHIIMEKPTGKTMDCFVEFPSYQAARECVDRFENTALQGRGTKIGARNVTIDLSSQAELMRAIFPRARLVEFDEATGKPTIMEIDENSTWTAGFRGYFTLEEVFGLTRFAENPARSPFVQKVNQRPYECMISTLYKFPWAETQSYTVAARNCLLEAAYKQLEILVRRISPPPIPRTDGPLAAYLTSQSVDQDNAQNNPPFAPNRHHSVPPAIEREVGLSHSLLFDLLFAAVNVPAFSELQKFCLCQIVGPYGRGVPLLDFAGYWPFQTLHPVGDVTEYAVKFWYETFQSGFDIMTANGISTTYEQYIVFNRNGLGHIIGEFTPLGVQLSFADAIEIETNIMMLYTSYGRDVWARMKKLEVSEWPAEKFMDPQQLAAEEHIANQRFEVNQQGFHDHRDSNVSPTTVHFAQQLPSSDKNTSSSDVGDVNIGQLTPYSRQQSAHHHLNAATAQDFVPASMRSKSFQQPISLASFNTVKSIWGPPELNQSQAQTWTHQGRPTDLRVNTNVANKDIEHGSSGIKTSSHTLLSAPLSAPLRDPFGPPSHLEPGFNFDRSKSYKGQMTGNSRRMSSQQSASTSVSESFNPFQRRISGQSQKQTFDPPTGQANRGRIDNLFSTDTRQRNASNDIGERMQKLSMTGNTASRSFSENLTYNSTALPQHTPSTSMNTSAIPINKGLAANSRGSPYPRNVQKYPDISYSVIRQPQFGSFNSQTKIQPGERSTSTITSPDRSTIERFRARSIPITAVGRGTLVNVTDPGGPGAIGDQSSFLYKRGSLPIPTPTTNITTPTSNVTPTESDDHKKQAKGNNQLGSRELWDQVRGYY